MSHTSVPTRTRWIPKLIALLALVLLGAGAAPAVRAGPVPVLHRDFVLVVDPGHGGTNEGCTSAAGDLHEKEVTLAIARQLQARLAQVLPHARVILTRDEDVTMTLAERVAFANEAHADLFLSIHANASAQRDQVGFETYVLDLQASNLEAARTAQRENDEGFMAPRSADPVAAMVRELELVSDRTRAAYYARAIQDGHVSRFPARVDRGVRQAPFDVLMGARMPAVLHEVGFLDHAEEGELLRSEAGRTQLVEILADATVAYYREIQRRQ